MNLKTDFGKRLKTLRLQNKITQEKLAEMAGIDVKHVSHIETGRSFPKSDLIEKFARALNIDYKILFDFKREPSRRDIIKEIKELCESAADDKLSLLYKIISDLIYE